MTREEHRRRAEVLLESAWKRSASVSGFLIQTPERRAELIATAHVHALLALPEILHSITDQEAR